MFICGVYIYIYNFIFFFLSENSRTYFFFAFVNDLNANVRELLYIVLTRMCSQVSKCLHNMPENEAPKK